MPTLADVLRQTGYAQDGTLATPTPTESPMTKALADHLASIPQKFNENQAHQMSLLNQAFPGNTYESMMTQGDPKAMAELAMQVPLTGMTNIYHGTSPEAAAAIAKRGFNVKKSADGTIWFTENPEIGEVSATGKGAVVKRILDKEKLKLATPEQADKYFIDQLISQGYHGVEYPGYGAGDFTHYQIFTPEKLGKEKVARKQLLEEQVNKLKD